MASTTATSLTDQLQRSSPFPSHVLLPKSETQCDQFLAVNPKFDGRGICVAIFDTGVDPGASGLQWTSDGKPKIVDLVDCTCSGDVSMEQKVSVIPTSEKTEDKNSEESITTSTSDEHKEVDSSVVVSPLTGRKFKLGSWEKKSANGTYHFGVKRAYELFSSTLTTRIKEERKKVFERDHFEAISKVRKQLEGNSELSVSDKKDLELQIEQMNDMYKNYDDPGPIYDCISFFDGQDWRVCIYPDDQQPSRASNDQEKKEEAEFIIDLSRYTLLTDYRKEQQYSIFTNADKLNYSVKFYDDGKILSIVTAGGSHGTHVAGIVGAYHKEEPNYNGVAPGCQIVSIKIGDSYLGTMETNTGVCRGIVATKENNCNLINMSYGESTFMPNQGRFASMISELVDKHNVVFVTSAGNSGPALSTAGTPGDNSDVISVGAYVSEDMGEVQYSLRDKVPENLYTWSSRGPSLDGWTTTISGPGAAITSVPAYELQKMQRMNGTSMSSPNVCGGIACLLSGLKQSGKPWNAHYIKRAIENSARSIESVDPFALGKGLLQIADAYAYMDKHPYNTTENLKYIVKTADGNRGIYLRSAVMTHTVTDHTINVQTKFVENAPNDDKINYHKRVYLESTQDWIQVPSYFVSLNETQSFVVRVDPTHLVANKAYHGEVLAVDADNVAAGPLFRLPVTVIKPQKVEKPVLSIGRIVCKPGSITRNFVVVPTGSEFAEITVSGLRIDTKQTYLLHCIQLMPKTAFSVHEYKKYMFLKQDDKEVHYVKTIPGTTMEICLAQFWSSLGDSEVTCNVEFRGVTPSANHVHIDAGDICGKIILKSELKNEELKLKAEFNTWTRHIRPKSSEIKTLTDPRDRQLNGDPVHSMVLTYTFPMEESAKVMCRIPTISSMLYESILEAQMIMLFTRNKQLLKVFDAWPTAFKLPKGEITVRVLFRHENLSLLESLKESVLNVDQTLEKPIAISMFPDPNKVIQRTGKIEKLNISLGTASALYIAAPESKDLPKKAKLGDTLFSKVTLFEKCTHASITVTYSVPSRTSKTEDKTTEKKELEKLDTRSSKEKFEDAVMEAAVKFLEAIMDKPEEFEPLFRDLLGQYPNNLSMLKLKLAYLMKELSKKKNVNINEIVSSADTIVSLIDRAELAIHIGTTPKNKDTTKEDYEWLKKDEEMNKKKAFLIDALYNKAKALADHATEENAELLNQTVKELNKWVDITSDFKHLNLHLAVLIKKKHYGKLIQTIRKALSENKASDAKAEKETFEKLRSIVASLGWHHWEEYLARQQLVNYPAAYPALQ